MWGTTVKQKAKSPLFPWIGGHYGNAEIFFTYVFAQCGYLLNKQYEHREISVLGGKRSWVPCTCTPKTLKPSQWQHSEAQINHKEYRRAGDCMAFSSVNSVLRSVNFIHYYCNVQTCLCHLGHFYLHWNVNKQNVLFWVALSHCVFLSIKCYYLLSYKHDYMNLVYLVCSWY